MKRTVNIPVVDPLLAADAKAITPMLRSVLMAEAPACVKAAALSQLPANSWLVPMLMLMT